MSELQALIHQAWADHADDAAGVALRLPLALDAVRGEDELIALARLAHHVYGEHLGAWADGLKFLAALARGPGFDAHGASGAALRNWRASLALASGEGDLRPTLTAGERISVSAQTAAALAPHDAARALQLLQEAAAEADQTGLADSDPATRALAVAGNNLAAALEELPTRDAGERELMILAARLGRLYWGRAGTWLEIERAEYRLAMTWLAAGDPAQARQHAQACLDLVEAQPEPVALERFFAHEALGLADRASGNLPGHRQALDAMRAVLEDLSPDDQRWCRASLDKLAAG